jgi:Curlin associated repeat
MRYLATLLLMTFSVQAQSLSPALTANPGLPPPNTNFVYIDQVGSNNNITVEQTGSDAKKAMIVSNGDLDTYTILQQGSGNHTASISPTPQAANANNSNNNISILQSGAGNHTASVLFQDPASNSGNVASITQAGGQGADKQFTLQLQGSGISAKVLQDNPTTPDSSSMQIICNQPPCTGYSYTKH